MNSKTSFKTLLTFYILASCYRILNAFFIQTQFDPDEYWQTLEPAYCLAFPNNNNDDGMDYSYRPTGNGNYNCAYTWEWTRRRLIPSTVTFETTSSSTKTIINFFMNVLHGPVRSYVSILPTYWFYKLIIILYDSLSSSSILLSTSLSTLSTNLISHGPLYWNALLITAPTDVATYYITNIITQNHQQHHHHHKHIPYIAFILSLTNWFHGYALIRTYSNSMETMLLLVGIALLSPQLFSTRTCCNNNHNNIETKIAFVLGGLSVVIRFTSLAAWIPLGIIIAHHLSSWFSCTKNDTRTCTDKQNDNEEKECRTFIWYIFHICALYGGIGVLIGCMVDWYFYSGGGLISGDGEGGVLPSLGNFHFNVILGKYKRER